MFFATSVLRQIYAGFVFLTVLTLAGPSIFPVQYKARSTQSLTILTFVRSDTNRSETGFLKRGLAGELAEEVSIMWNGAGQNKACEEKHASKAFL